MQKKFINEMVKLAQKSFDQNEVPVGAIIVRDDKIIGVGINDREQRKSVIGHAEINAIEDACKNIGDWRLDGCEMYVTLNPCLMCRGAIIESRIKRVYYLCDKTNVCYNIGKLELIKLDDKIMEEKYLQMLRLFFENKRN